MPACILESIYQASHTKGCGVKVERRKKSSKRKEDIKRDSLKHFKCELGKSAEI